MKYVVAYMDAEILAEISGNEPLARNTLNIDLEGTPAFDLSDTDENEGIELQATKDTLAQAMNESDADGYVLDSGQLSAELLRPTRTVCKIDSVHSWDSVVLSGLAIAVSTD